MQRLERVWSGMSEHRACMYKTVKEKLKVGEQKRKHEEGKKKRTCDPKSLTQAEPQTRATFSSIKWGNRLHLILLW